MDTNITPAPAPAPTPAPPAPAVAPVVTTTPAVSSGGGTNIVSTFRNLNWIEIGFGILGATALYYAIYYYKYNINQSKAFALQVQNRLDELDIKLADVNSVFQNEQQQQPTGNDIFLI